MSTADVSLDDACAVLCHAGIVGLSPRPTDFLPLLRMGCLTQLWSCEAASADWAEQFNVELISLEATLNTRQRWRTVDLDRLLPFLGRPAQGPRRLLPFGLTDGWRVALADNEELTAIPSPVERQQEWTDKIAMRRWLYGLGVPLPVSAVATTESLSYERYAKQLGPSYVLQVPVGSAGIGTFLVSGESDIPRALLRYPAVSHWLVSAYAGNTTLNFHGLAADSGAACVVTHPSLQISGLVEAGAAFGEYCGSDFLAPYTQPSRVLHECQSITRRIGVSLTLNGYRGIFGVDFAVQDGVVVVLEVNCRIQASTWLLGEIELLHGELPTLCRHVLGVGGYPQLQVPADGIQLVVRYTASTSCRLIRAPTAGVYGWHKGALSWRRSGVGLLDCMIGEVVITDLPQRGVLIYPGATLGRLVTRTKLTTSDGRSLTPDGSALVEAFRAMSEFSLPENS